jgi:5'-3' exonuclease
VIGDLNQYFPDDFDIDLNGRTLPWEAVCLIPFVEEKKFLEYEKDLISNLPLKDEDSLRNTIIFEYYSFEFNQ